MTKKVEMILGSRLTTLMQRCQEVCVAECCGLDAFDFSPIHVASYLATHYQPCRDGVVAEIMTDLEAFRRGPDGVPDTEMVSVKVLNESMSRWGRDTLADEIVAAIGTAKEILDRYDVKS